MHPTRHYSRMLPMRYSRMWRKQERPAHTVGRPSKQVRRNRCLAQDDLDAAVLRLTHAVGGVDQRTALAEALDRDRLTRHA